MAYPTPTDARRWLELRDNDPIAFAALPSRAREIAQDYDDLERAHARTPAPRGTREERSDELLALRDSDDGDDRARFAALPDRLRDELQVYEDVMKGRGE